MSGYEMVEEDESMVALGHLVLRSALVITAIVAAGFALGSMFEVVYLDASAWPVFWWFALAQLLVSTEKIMARAIHPTNSEGKFRATPGDRDEK